MSIKDVWIPKITYDVKLCRPSHLNLRLCGGFGIWTSIGGWLQVKQLWHFTKMWIFSDVISFAEEQCVELQHLLLLKHISRTEEKWMEDFKCMLF